MAAAAVHQEAHQRLKQAQQAQQQQQQQHQQQRRRWQQQQQQQQQQEAAELQSPCDRPQQPSSLLGADSIKDDAQIAPAQATPHSPVRYPGDLYHAPP